jgi:hypothetical protein
MKRYLLADSLRRCFPEHPFERAVRFAESCYFNAMMQKRTRQFTPEHEAIRRPLLELHDALLHLHKVLIESERAVYETDIGLIQSPNHFFQLLTGDPWFGWLRPVSQLIVAIDERLDEKESLTNAGVDTVMSQAVFLLIPAESGGEFGERYVAALQRDPRVVLAHAEVAKRIGSGKAQA